MANWFCSVFNVVCVVNVCPVHAVDLNELIDSAWVVIVPGQKMHYFFLKKPYYYCIVTTNQLIDSTTNQLIDSTTNQLIDLVDEIHKAVDSKKPLEVRAVFLDISKAFDKVWDDGLIFEMRQNGISGNLLKLFKII